MPEKPKPKWSWRNAGTFTPHLYAGIPSFYNSLSKKLRKKYFKTDMGNKKLIMLKNGTLNKPIDIFDLFYHSAPLILLIIKFIRDYSNS